MPFWEFFGATLAGKAIVKVRSLLFSSPGSLNPHVNIQHALLVILLWNETHSYVVFIRGLLLVSPCWI